MSQHNALFSYMSFLSRKYFRNEWQDGLEYYLWDCLKNASHLEGMELIELERLSERYDGWVIWGDENVPVLLSMAHWISLFNEEMG